MTYPRQTINPAEAADQRRIAATLGGVRALGWSRQQLADLCDELNPYAVWRAQTGRVRVSEVALWDVLLTGIADGTLRRPRHAGAVDRHDRIVRALDVLERADRARSITTLRQIVAETRSVLTDTK